MDICFLNALKGRATYKALANAIAEVIDEGRLLAGERLPSSREIALSLETSRTTVVRAFDELIARGYLTATKGSSTIVALKHSRQRIESFAPPEEDAASFNWKDRYSELAQQVAALPASREAQCGQDSERPALPHDLSPCRELRRAIISCMDRIDDFNLEENSDAFGYIPLRKALCDYLRRSKGILCDPEQIVLFSSAHRGLNHLAELLVNEGDTAIVENPGPVGAASRFKERGAQVVAIACGRGALDTRALNTVPQHAQWLHVSPSGHEPSGVMLREDERRKLLAWAQANHTAIIEEVCSDFNYGHIDAQSLFSMDKTGSVIYASSLSHLLNPLLALGFLILPARLVPLFKNSRRLFDRHLPVIEHQALADLMNEGQFEKTLRIAWKALRKRRSALIFALKKSFANKVDILPSDSGTVIMARFSPSWPLRDILQSAQAADLSAWSTAQHYLSPPGTNEVFVDFAAFDEQSIEVRVERFFSELAQTKALQYEGAREQLIGTSLIASTVDIAS
jgi:GntR family transcriptional regulator/MocR family aminotransferase